MTSEPPPPSTMGPRTITGGYHLEIPGLKLAHMA